MNNKLSNGIFKYGKEFICSHPAIDKEIKDVKSKYSKK